MDPREALASSLSGGDVPQGQPQDAGPQESPEMAAIVKIGAMVEQILEMLQSITQEDQPQGPPAPHQGMMGAGGQ